MTKKSKKRGRKHIPIIGKYIDTPTKAEIGIVYFTDDIGDFRFSMDTLKNVILKGCRFSFKISEAKRKKKFFKELQPFLSTSDVFGTGGTVPFSTMPLVFGLLKLRKNKERKFVLFQSADIFFNSKVVNVIGVALDNLLYLDLVNKLKTP